MLSRVPLGLLKAGTYTREAGLLPHAAHVDGSEVTTVGISIAPLLDDYLFSTTLLILFVSFGLPLSLLPHHATIPSSGSMLGSGEAIALFYTVQWTHDRLSQSR